jgi:hypothetical protein
VSAMPESVMGGQKLTCPMVGIGLGGKLVFQHWIEAVSTRGSQADLDAGNSLFDLTVANCLSLISL